jgi:hypothetical protein
VTESLDHPHEQPAVLVVGLADQDSCHISMIGEPRVISGVRAV